VASSAYRGSDSIGAHDALVRIERMHGLKPHRTVPFVIRVPVEQFDGLVQALRETADLESFHPDDSP